MSFMLRKSSDRGKTSFGGWLSSYHTFSFGQYQDPEFMGYRSLRVINDDTVQPGAGFDTHRHHDMEIITMVLKGKLEHKDSEGNGSVIGYGAIQRMTAGQGIEHSEFNASDKELVHFLQIWILPKKRDLKPSYEEQTFDVKEEELQLIGSCDSHEDGVVTIHQDVNLYRGFFATKSSMTYDVKKDRGIWIHQIDGSLDINGIILNPGDSLAVEDEASIMLTMSSECEFLLFDLA